MAFRVTIQPEALSDIDDAALFIAAQGNPERARRWREAALDAIDGLFDRPERGMLIPEAKRLRLPYRHIHDHAHRIVYFVDKASQTVVFARVYHGARRALRPDDL